MTKHTQHPDLRRKAIPLVAVGLGMAALAWAAVPLYDMFCRVTGFGGTTQVAAQESSQVLDRMITVRFDASTVRGMPLEFRPIQTTMNVRIGETVLAFYEAYNPTKRAVGGTTSYNVAPFSMGGYFTKIECFCFIEQVLQPGERVQMPVTFYIDPDMINDVEAEGVTTVTLSYTFFETELDGQAALGQTGAEIDTDTSIN